jgi:hypothetical protein
MDYSLMIIVARGDSALTVRKGWRLVNVGQELVMAFGIIDYLQEYNS